MNIDHAAIDIQGQVEDGEDAHNPAHTGSVLNTIPSTINNKFQHVRLDEVVRLLNGHRICQSTNDCSRPRVFNLRSAQNYVPGAPGLGHLVHHEEMGLGY
jgi:hypothetical protein